MSNLICRRCAFPEMDRSETVSRQMALGRGVETRNAVTAETFASDEVRFRCSEGHLTGVAVAADGPVAASDIPRTAVLGSNESGATHRNP